MKVIITILSAILLFSLSACGNSSGGSSNDTSTQKQSQTDKTTQNTDKNSTNATSSHSNTNSSNGTTNQSDTEAPKQESGTNNIKKVKGFTQNKNQSFTVNLKAWGNVRFVSGKITGGTHIPTVFYLTNDNGDILYNFNDAPFPYNVDVKAASFQDVSKDGLKDMIIIVVDNDNSEKPIAAIWLQDADKKFTCDTKLSQEINQSGNNKDIKTATDYLSKKL